MSLCHLFTTLSVASLVRDKCRCPMKETRRNDRNDTETEYIHAGLLVLLVERYEKRK